MRITVSITPLTSDTLLATVNQFDIHIPKLLLKGIVRLKPIIELAALKKLCDFLQQQGVAADVRSVELLTDAENAAITGVAVDTVSLNYTDAAVALLPLVKVLLAEHPSVRPALNALSAIEPESAQIVAGALSPLRSEQIESVLRSLSVAYQDALFKLLNGLLAERRIPVTVREIVLNT